MCEAAAAVAADSEGAEREPQQVDETMEPEENDEGEESEHVTDDGETEVEVPNID